MKRSHKSPTLSARDGESGGLTREMIIPMKAGECFFAVPAGVYTYEVSHSIHGQSAEVIRKGEIKLTACDESRSLSGTLSGTLSEVEASRRGAEVSRRKSEHRSERREFSLLIK